MHTVSPTAVYSSPEQRAALIEHVSRVVCEETTKVVSERYGPRTRALVLTGSISRGEPALLTREQTVRVLGDADFIAVFEEGSEIPQAEEMRQVCELAEKGIAHHGLQCQIGISAVHPKFLRRLRPNIFTYELLECGRVVLGDPTILGLAPPLGLSDIPLEDAWRTLCNRIIEFLEVLGVTSLTTSEVPLELQYRAVKLWLDMATSFLVAVGSYAPTYEGREQALSAFAAKNVSIDEWPFSLPHFSSVVTRATAWRISGVDDSAHFSDWQMLQDTVKYAHALWRWELCRLTNSSSVTSDQQLWQSWANKQTFRANLRGWLHLLRKRRWHRSVPQWPRWLKSARSASPRYWIYGIGSELFFHLPALLFNPDKTVQPRLRELLDALPESHCSRQVGDWRRLAAEIARNYNEFVVTTRS